MTEGDKEEFEADGTVAVDVGCAVDGAAVDVGCAVDGAAVDVGCAVDGAAVDVGCAVDGAAVVGGGGGVTVQYPPLPAQTAET